MTDEERWQLWSQQFQLRAASVKNLKWSAIRRKLSDEKLKVIFDRLATIDKLCQSVIKQCE